MKTAQEEELREKEHITKDPKELSKTILSWYQGLLYRFSRAVGTPTDSHEVHKQIVVPEKYHSRLLCLSHEDHLAGHFGASKAVKRMAEHFFWPKMKEDVKQYVNSCMACQMVRKPN